MASWGLELEIQDVALILQIFGYQIIGEPQRAFASPIQIGPDYRQEIFGLQEIYRKIYLERFQKAPPPENLPQFSMYAVQIILERQERGVMHKLPFRLSGDHSKGILIPELISLPIGRYSREVGALDVLEHFNTLFTYGKRIALNGYPETACRFMHLAMIKQLGIPIYLIGNYSMVRRSDLPIGMKSDLPIGIAVQITSIIDLTHFSSSGKDNPALFRFLHIIKEPTIKTDIAALTVARYILLVTKSTIDFALNAWIEGGIGLAMSQMLIVLAGTRDPGITTEKNLWHLYPKTSIRDILRSLYLADISQYTQLVNLIGSHLAHEDFFHNACRVTGKEDDVDFSFYFQARDRTAIARRLQYLHIEFKNFQQASFSVERALHAFLISVIVNPIQSAQVNMLWHGVSASEIRKYLQLADDLFGKEMTRIEGAAQPGYGRAKFELRGLSKILPPYEFHPAELFAKPDIFIQLMHDIAAPCVRIPARPGREGEDESTVDLSTEFSEESRTDKFWIPGLVELGRRAPPRPPSRSHSSSSSGSSGSSSSRSSRRSGSSGSSDSDEEL